MKYYKLIKNYNDIEAQVLTTQWTGRYSERLYAFKKNISEWNNNEFIFNIDKDRSLEMSDLLRNDIDLLLFSNRIKKVCEKEKLMGTQFLEVKINDLEGNKDLVPYWYTHLEYADEAVLDINKSKAGEKKDFHGETIYSFTIPAFNINKIKNLDIFRIPQSVPGIYVSEKFKDMFEENKFTGATFMEVISA